MAIPRKLPVEFGTVFPFGAYMVGEISPVRDYDRSTRENVIQAVDPDTGLLLWAVDVVDADPEATKSNRTMTVKVSGPGPAGARSGSGRPAVPCGRVRGHDRDGLHRGERQLLAGRLVAAGEVGQQPVGPHDPAW